MVKVQGGVVIAVDVRPDRVELAQTSAQITPSSAALRLGGGLCSDDWARRGLCHRRGGLEIPVPVQQAIRHVQGSRALSSSALCPDLPRDEMYIKELQLLMSRAYGPGSYDPAYEKQGRDYPLPYVRWTENRNMEEFLRLIDRGRIQLQPLITHQFALEDAPQAYQTIMDQSSNSLAVLLRYPSAATDQTTRAVFEPTRKVEAPAQGLRVPSSCGARGCRQSCALGDLPNLKRFPTQVCEPSTPRAVRAGKLTPSASARPIAVRITRRFCKTRRSTLS